MTEYPPVHQKPQISFSFDRLDMLWDRYPQYHEMSVFSTLDALLEEHESYQKDFDGLREEYVSGGYEKFLVQLSWSDLPYRRAAKQLIEASGPFSANPYVEEFMDQFSDLDTDRKACFLFPESFISQFFVIMEVCGRAESFHPVKNLFPDEEKVHYLAVFDKKDMESVLLMFHLLYSNTTQDLYGGYSLYDYSLPWYQNHLWQDGVVLRSPYLPDRIAKYQGNLPFYHNPAKTTYVRRNIGHILECGYFSSELEFFLNLTRIVMPFFQWWYTDLALYEEKDGFRTNWRLERTKIRTKLTAEGVIKPKWKHELSLFHGVRKRYPDILYQYRPDWLGRQSLDLFIPSLRTAIEYQGIQHYRPVDFFGGEEALAQRQELDRQKRLLCEQNDVRLIEWPYSLEPTDRNIREILQKDEEDGKMSQYLIKTGDCPSQDAWIREAKADPSAEKIGMYLTHTGVVRKSAKARVRYGEDSAGPVSGMLFSYDDEKVERAIAEALALPGVYYIRVWLNSGELVLGDTIMQVLIGGDIRPHVIDGLQFLVGKIKSECVVEEERFE